MQGEERIRLVGKERAKQRKLVEAGELSYTGNSLTIDSAAGALVFDPFGLFARHIPEAVLHRGIRFFMVVVLAAFLVHRVRQYPGFALKPLWFVETALFVVLIIAFMLRSAPCSRSQGVREVLVPLIGGALPFGLLCAPPLPAITGSRVLLYGALWWMTIATSLTVAGMWTLRRSFSITVEARSMVVGGPYRFIRHPIYLGEMLAAVAVAFIRLSLANVMLICLFIAIQLYRSCMEENKLRRAFPEYDSFAAHSWWLW
jgi:protein-S-isoprenylcysteine O-methyltransferase Ste14